MNKTSAKKMLSNLLLVVMMFNQSVALSESVPFDGIIRFQDVEWHSDIDTVATFLALEIPGRQRIRAGERMCYQSFWYTGHIAAANDAGFSLTLSPQTDFFVGGHMIEEIEAYFLYGVCNSTLLTDKSSSRFVMAQYEFDVNGQNVDSVYGDLYDKLCDLYGEPFATSEVLDMFAVWHGVNETGVYILGGRSYLYLCYGKIDCYLDISEILSIRNAELVSDIDSKDGL